MIIVADIGNYMAFTIENVRPGQEFTENLLSKHRNVSFTRILVLDADELVRFPGSFP